MPGLIDGWLILENLAIGARTVIATMAMERESLVSSVPKKPMGKQNGWSEVDFQSYVMMGISIIVIILIGVLLLLIFIKTIVITTSSSTIVSTIDIITIVIIIVISFIEILRILLISLSSLTC